MDSDPHSGERDYELGFSPLHISERPPRRRAMASIFCDDYSSSPRFLKDGVVRAVDWLRFGEVTEVDPVVEG